MTDARVGAAWYLSVVVPVFNEAQGIEDTYRTLTDALSWVPSLELVFVDDGSSDASADVLRRICERDGRVRLIILSRNFGHEVAIAAGLQWTRGDAVVVMDADLQDPPELIREFVQRWRDGFDVVYGVRTTRKGEPLLKRGTSRLFYRTLARLSDVPIPADVGDYRLMDRRVVEVLNRMPETRRFFRGMVAWVGFRQCGVAFEREPRRYGRSHYSLPRLWRLSVDAIIGFSVQPLRWASRVGALIGLGGIAWAGHVVVRKLENPAVAIVGWSSLMAAVLLIGGVQLLVLGLLGDYVGSVLEQVRGRPLYVVREVVGEPHALADLDAAGTAPGHGARTRPRE